MPEVDMPRDVENVTARGKPPTLLDLLRVLVGVAECCWRSCPRMATMMSSALVWLRVRCFLPRRRLPLVIFDLRVLLPLTTLVRCTAERSWRSNLRRGADDLLVPFFFFVRPGLEVLPLGRRDALPFLVFFLPVARPAFRRAPPPFTRTWRALAGRPIRWDTTARDYPAQWHNSPQIKWRTSFAIRSFFQFLHFVVGQSACHCNSF